MERGLQIYLGQTDKRYFNKMEMMVLIQTLDAMASGTKDIKTINKCRQEMQKVIRRYALKGNRNETLIEILRLMTNEMPRLIRILELQRKAS